MLYPPWIKTVIVHGVDGKSGCKRLRFAISEVAFRGVKGHESHYRQPLMTGTGATKQSLTSYSAAFFRHFPIDVLPRLFPCFCADLADSLGFEEVLGLRGFLVGLSVVSVDFFLTINGAFVPKQRRLSHACMQKPASYSHLFISLSFSLFQL